MTEYPDIPGSIEHRADGTVVSYYRGDYEPCRPEDAECIRLVRPDGSVVILRADGEPYPPD